MKATGKFWQTQYYLDNFGKYNIDPHFIFVCVWLVRVNAKYMTALLCFILICKFENKVMHIDF